LAYGAKSPTDTRNELGLRADKSFALENAVLTLRGRLAWAHDFDPDRSIAATFQALPGASFVVNGAPFFNDLRPAPEFLALGAPRHIAHILFPRLALTQSNRKECAGSMTGAVAAGSGANASITRKPTLHPGTRLGHAAPRRAIVRSA
jgi:hypothetical protein